MNIDLNQERERFEQAALQHAIQRRQVGNVIDDNGSDLTHETLFWKDGNGNYGIYMFNAAWWGWKSACEAMTPKEVVLDSRVLKSAANAAFDQYAAGFDQEGGDWLHKDEAAHYTAGYIAANVRGPADLLAELQKEVARLNEEEHRSQLHLERALRASQFWREKVTDLKSLLSEVSAVYTREDDLPDDLLPRIDAALAPVTTTSDATKL